MIGTIAKEENNGSRGKIKGAASAEGEIKCIREKIKCQGENQGLREEIKGTKAEEENEKFRGEIRGADRAKESYEIHEWANKM